jgi:hypothetical protein
MARATFRMESRQRRARPRSKMARLCPLAPARLGQLRPNRRGQLLWGSMGWWMKDDDRQRGSADEDLGTTTWVLSIDGGPRFGDGWRQDVARKRWGRWRGCRPTAVDACELMEAPTGDGSRSPACISAIGMPYLADVGAKFKHFVAKFE